MVNSVLFTLDMTDAEVNNKHIDHICIEWEEEDVDIIQLSAKVDALKNNLRYKFIGLSAVRNVRLTFTIP